MKHFKHREKPKFCFVDWLMFLEGCPGGEGRRESRVPCLLSAGPGTLMSFH